MTLAAYDPRQALARPRWYAAAMAAIGADAGMRIFVRDVLRAQPGERVLDIGCGPGRLFPWLPPVEYLGVDLSAAYIDRARALFPQTRFEHADATRQDAASHGTFDLAVASGLLHHLSDAAAGGAIAFAHARLRPGGRLITLDCTCEPGQSRVSRFLAACDRGRFVRSGEQYAALARGRFERVTLIRREDLLRLPYRHVILECTK